MGIKLRSSLSERYTQNTEICYKIILILLEYFSSGCLSCITIQNKIQILTHSKVWKIYLIETGSSLKY